MESALTHACKIKVSNFEGPFDLLFHLIEKNQLNIYDIPINDITDQYMEYLYAMQEMDLEIASEFLIVAATLLHIKSKMLLPQTKEKQEEEKDPREELILRLVEYKKYKEFSDTLREREKLWNTVFYKLPESIAFAWSEKVMELSPDELKKAYGELLLKNRKKMNNTTDKMAQIIQHEKVSLKGKMREIVRVLITRAMVKFSDLFSLGKKTRLEVITGFMAALELSRKGKVTLSQKTQFSEIMIFRAEDQISELDIFEEERSQMHG